MNAASNPRATAGDNSEAGGVAGARLLSIVQRVERLAEEKAALQADIKDIFTEAKSAGFDAKVVRVMLARRKMDALERDEQDMLLIAYERALDLL